MLALTLSAPGYALAQDDEPTPDTPTPISRSLDAIEAYVTSPLRWDRTDWMYFGGTIAAIGVAHSFDSDVRRHFTAHSTNALNSSDTYDVHDVLPAAALLLGTWGYESLTNDSDGRREFHTMMEAATLAVGTNYVLKFAGGRQRPDQTSNANRWWAGGSSFPSVHATLAFAVGSVLAESGNDEYRWIRRALGYGVAGFTVYERLDHNAHWLSDTVAGAALGTATARFAMNRRDNAQTEVGVEPLPGGGFMLAFSHQLP